MTREKTRKSHKQDPFIITDTVRSIRSSRIYKKVARQGERFWVIKCLDHTVRVFETELSDNKFITMLEDKTVIDQQVRFNCHGFWNHVIEAELLEND